MKTAALALLAAVAVLVFVTYPSTAAAPDVLYKGKTARYWGVAWKGQLDARKVHERTILRQRKQIVELTRKPDPAPAAWTPAHVVSYAGFEPGVSDVTACPAPYHDLDIYAYTVAVTYGLGLDGPGGRPACGAKIVLSNGVVEQVATVTDRTLSRYTFELTPALSWVFGAPRRLSGFLTWSAHLKWRHA